MIISKAIKILSSNKLTFALEKIMNLVISEYSIPWIALLFYDNGDYYPWQVIGERSPSNEYNIHERMLYYMDEPIGKLSSLKNLDILDKEIIELISFVFFQTVRENSVNFKLSRLHMLSEISRNANDYFDLKSGMEKVIEIANQFLDFDIALLYKYEQEENLLLLERSYGNSKNSLDIFKRIYPGDNPLWKVAMAKKPGLFYHRNIKSYLAVPLISGERLLGVLAIGSKQSYAYNEQDIISLNILTTQMSNIHSIINSLAILRSKTDEFIESMPFGLLTIDINQKINSFNKTASNYFNKLSTSIIGQDIDLLGDSKILAMLKETIKTGTSIENFEIEDNDIYYEISCFPFKDESGKTFGAAIIFKDISEIRRLKNELEVKKRLSMLGEMAASMAHEIRNPLSGIRMLVQILRDEFEKEPERREYTNVILEEVDRLESFVSGILEYTRPSAFKKVDFSVSELFNSTLLLLKPLLDRNDIKTEMEFKDFRIYADFNKLKHIFINLIKNSVNAVEKCGGKIIFSASKSDGKIILSIEDDGCGIPDNIKEKIFEPFYTTHESGTGLGLPLVKKLVEDHNGIIELDSSKEKGTKFSIILPDTQLI